jgi:hypothetical protein
MKTEEMESTKREPMKEKENKSMQGIQDKE